MCTAHRYIVSPILSLKRFFMRLDVKAVLFCLTFVSLNTGAYATTLYGTVGADNGAYIYLSTSQSSFGTLIGTSSNWNPTSSFNATLVPGSTYYLNIAAYNVGGPGGLIGSFSLSDANARFANGGQSLTTETSDWKGAFNTSLPTGVTTPPTAPPSTWVTPTYATVSEGKEGVYPWNAVPGVSSAAEWIWSSDSQSGGTTPCPYCWVDFSSTAITVNAPASSQGSSVPAPSVYALLLIALLSIGFGRSFAAKGPRP